MGFIDLLVKPFTRSRATVGYPARPADSVRTTRAPRFQPDLCTDDRSCETICPTAAITITPAPDAERRWALDYGKCVFCAECIRVCPAGAIAGTGDFELAARVRDGVVAVHTLRGAAGD